MAEEQNESALMIGACRALAATFFFSGDFEAARKYAMRGVEIWRSGGAPSHAEFLDAPPSFVCAMRRYPNGISEKSTLAKQP